MHIWEDIQEIHGTHKEIQKKLKKIQTATARRLWPYIDIRHRAPQGTRGVFACPLLWCLWDWMYL